MANWSEADITYFAKNSDRSPNEPHLVLHIPGTHHEKGAKVKCTYIEIPQAGYTREMILYKPSWIWGAEMGVNEARVAIGNEAVFTKSKKGKSALTGMDMLRLALERADNAASAVEILIMLLETYGQGGNCGYDHAFYYDNSFLASDPKEAYVLETSGRNYAVMRVENKYAISNCLSIEKNHINRSGIGPGDSFANRFTEPVYTYFSAAKARRRSVLDSLTASAGAAEIFGILRGHNARLNGKEFSRGSVKSVCMHGGGLVGDHTTGSLVAVLRPEKPVTLWSTGASTPCISAFKPVFWGSGAAPVFEDPMASREYWLKREQLHRAVIAGKVNAGLLRGKIKSLETEWMLRESRIMSDNKPDTDMLLALSGEASKQEQELIDEFYDRSWEDLKGKGRFISFWNKKNRDLLNA